MKTERIYNLLEILLRILAVCIFLALFLSSFVLQVRVSHQQESFEHVTFHLNRIYVWAFLVLILGLLISIRRILRKTDARVLFLVLSAMYMAVGVLFIFWAGNGLRADARQIHFAVEEFMQQNYSFLDEGGYLFHYPYQLGMVLYEMLLLSVNNNIEVVFLFNLFYVILINFLLWKITDILLENPLCSKYMILLEFAFVPQLLFILFAYGTIPGFTAMIISLYFFVRFMKEMKYRYLLLCILFACISCLFKSNYMIGAIAMSLVLFLHWLKERKKRSLIAIPLMMVSVVFSGKLFLAGVEAMTGKEIGSGEPKILWIAMGMRDQSPMVGGWYDAFNWNTFIEVDYDEEAATEVAKKVILERLQVFAENPGYAAKFYAKKIISTWCDPLFESTWSGPVYPPEQTVNDERILVIYDEGEVHQMLADYCGAYLILLYLAAGVSAVIFFRGKKDPVLLFGIIYFFGGFFFHILWETKGQYVYPYVFCLLPYAAYCVDRLSGKAETGFRHHKKA